MNPQLSRRNLCACVSSVALQIVAAVLATSFAFADGCGACGTNDKGAMIAKKVLSLEKGQVKDGPPGQVWDYGTAPYCGGDIPDSPGGVECELMKHFCIDKPGDGPAAWVFQRKTNPETPWLRLGYTCYPYLLPSKVDMAKIAEAFHQTNFALPGLEIQPPKNRTLVTLPTYFAVDWPHEGFEPEEEDVLDPSDWFGMQITIKPVLQSVTYDFGDGSSEGPTTSTGGPYPSGDIVKTYERGGKYQVRADAVYKGYVMVDGSEWIEIPGEVSIAGTPEVLTVLTANNSLYLPGG